MSEGPKLKRLSLVARHSPTSSSFQPGSSQRSPDGENGQHGQSTPHNLYDGRTRRARPMSMYGDLGSPSSASGGSGSSRMGWDSLDLSSPSPRRRGVYTTNDSSHPTSSETSTRTPSRTSTPQTIDTAGASTTNGTAPSESTQSMEIATARATDTPTRSVNATDTPTRSANATDTPTRTTNGAEALLHRTHGSTSSASSDEMPTPPNPLSPLEQITPRLNRHVGKRSSISYSPSHPTVGMGAVYSPVSRGNLERLERSSLDRNERRSSLGILLEGGPGTPSTPSGNSGAPLTLAERHAELLHSIAASERRVAELRAALSAEEKSLAVLRRQFSTAVAADAVAISTPRSSRTGSISEPMMLRAKSPPSASPRPLTGASTSRPLTGSGTKDGSVKEGSTSGKSDGPLASLKDSLGSSNPAADTIGVGALWSAMAQDAEDTIQEGKRFWGQLMKSVSSAGAGASAQGGQKARPESGINLSGLKGMLPSLPLPSLMPEPQPTRPKDVRLKRASLTAVSPSPEPKVSLSGSSGSEIGEIGLSRSASRNSVGSSLGGSGLARSVSRNSAVSVASARSVASAGSRADRDLLGVEGMERRGDAGKKGIQKAEEQQDGRTPSEPPTPRDLAAVLDNVIW